MPFAAGLWATLQRDLPLLYPPILLIITATVMLWPGDLFVPRGEKSRWATVTVVALAIAALLVGGTPSTSGFSRMFQVDGLTRGFQ